LLEKRGINRETENIQITSYESTGFYNRAQQFSIVLQEFIIHSLNVIRYSDLDDLIAACRDNSCSDFIFSCLFITSNGIGSLRKTGMSIVDNVYEYYRESTISGKVISNVISK